MTIDGDYVPSAPSHVIPGETRVMMLNELDDKDKVRVARAIRKHPGMAGLISPQAGIIKSGGDYYCVADGTFHDFMESAQKNADITGRPNVVHIHAHSVPCDDQEHFTVEPDPIRTVAVGGPQHA